MIIYIVNYIVNIEKNCSMNTKYKIMYILINIHNTNLINY